MIIGITGPIASGKTILSEMLVMRGFMRFSLSGEVREEAKKLGLPIERVALQNLGNEMRLKHGREFWAKRVIVKMQKDKNYVIEGIRNPGEVEEFRKIRNFILIGIDAPIEQRLQWIISRNKDSDPKTFEGVKVIDSRDRGFGENESGQQSDACYQMADAYILNNTDFRDLREKIEKVINELGC